MDYFVVARNRMDWFLLLAAFSHMSDECFVGAVQAARFEAPAVYPAVKFLRGNVPVVSKLKYCSRNRQLTISLVDFLKEGNVSCGEVVRSLRRKDSRVFFRCRLNLSDCQDRAIELFS